MVNETDGITRSSTTRQVYEHIKQDITNAVYPGGYQLKQELIAQELNVSRIPVREALVQLESEGFVKIVPFKGAVVTQLTIADAIDQFEARIVLEPYLAVLALKQATEADIAKIMVTLGIYENAVLQEFSAIELSQLNWAFHSVILAPSHRPRTLSIVKMLHNSTQRYIRLQIDFPEARSKALRDHKKIANAFFKRDELVLEKIFREHIVDGLSGVKDRLGSDT